MWLQILGLLALREFNEVSSLEVGQGRRASYIFLVHGAPQLHAVLGNTIGHRESPAQQGVIDVAT